MYLAVELNNNAMKNFNLNIFCMIIFFNQNLIGQTVFANAGHNVKLTIDLTIDSGTASIQMKVPIQNNLDATREEYLLSSVADRDITNRTESHPSLNGIKQMDVTEVDLVPEQFSTSGTRMKPLVWMYHNLMYLMLVGIGLFALALMWKEEKTVVII